MAHPLKFLATVDLPVSDSPERSAVWPVGLVVPWPAQARRPAVQVVQAAAVPPGAEVVEAEEAAGKGH